MRYFKRFSEFCGGFSAFYALMYLLIQYMAFHPVNVDSAKDKLLRFFEEDAAKDYRSYALLVLMLAGALVLGRIFSRLPTVGFIASLFPMAQTLMMLRENKLYERPMLHVLLGILFVLGFVIDALLRDREDGRRRAFVLTNACGILFALLGVAVWARLQRLIALSPDEEALDAFSYADFAIYDVRNTDQIRLLLTFSAIIAVTVLISLLLRDLYFIDLVLSAGPAIYAVYLFHAEKLTLFAMAVLLLSLFYFVCRLLLTHLEPMRMAKGRDSQETF